jgi:hypothetical protein
MGLKEEKGKMGKISCEKYMGRVPSIRQKILTEGLN